MKNGNMLHIKQVNTLPKERMAYLPYSRHSESQLVGEFLEEKDTIFGEIQQCFKGRRISPRVRGDFSFSEI